MINQMQSGFLWTTVYSDDWAFSFYFPSGQLASIIPGYVPMAAAGAEYSVKSTEEMLLSNLISREMLLSWHTLHMSHIWFVKWANTEQMVQTCLNLRQIIDSLYWLHMGLLNWLKKISLATSSLQLKDILFFCNSTRNNFFLLTSTCLLLT